ncbi:AraC family transcriptional regulator of adaptative response/methylated-DNA-[protein]-cysteine methyltransferase [Lewinella aquimaris]|uniref:methylated-DNA--[protein]-cysteine S-methyltransferase n=1 Tax=Neolewinella aquimaris TaxID=1835722 RepID=A0A840E653_9BACT|nr:methylated-DNA--[protein]-cysteine S-methyltransferase [Neolewinella aquimaris]MBB4079433.1 AraC family transcriptional regulator of adaptative response/methylated-DNA-[protein]-cysteine methyltransferase [Neolewinella aquimaris]
MQEQDTYQTIARAIRFIRAQQEEQPSLDAIATHVGLSKFHLQRLFTECVGVSPKAYLQYLTTESAKTSLSAGRSTLAAAYDSGLSGNSRLHAHFLKVEGCTPGAYRLRGQGLQITYHTFSTAFGRAVVAESQIGVCSLVFLEEDDSPAEHLSAAFPKAQIRPGIGVHSQRVTDFFRNWKTPDRPIGLDLRGTSFQLQVWKALLRIPTGQAVAYGDLARAIGKPAASRAVGTAIGSNPIAYLIPCHRVIRGDGQSGGYRWGPERKAIINGWEAAR